MVVPLHRCVLRLSLALSAVFLCQCETQRTVTTKRSSISFDQKMWGGHADNDSPEIRSKFADRGYQITQDGSIKADRPDLYADSKVRGLGGTYRTKEARLSKRDAVTKEFKTPEYLKRQEFAGVSSAREGSQSARESDRSRSLSGESGQLFKNRAKNKDTSELSSYATGEAREAGEVFKTKEDRDAEKVGAGAKAKGTPRSQNYQENVAMSMDDVKKLLNPNAYARAKGIGQ